MTIPAGIPGMGKVTDKVEELSKKVPIMEKKKVVKHTRINPDAQDDDVNYPDAIGAGDEDTGE